VEAVDAVVIGAGAVGLAVGRALAKAGHETLVLEAAAAIGQGVSSRNSEVIHAGLYYAPRSLKARLCVQGRALLLDFCDSHAVPYSLCGKLVVATAEDQHAALQRLGATATANGVPIEAWTAAAARALEPELHCTAALWSPNTGILDSHAYMLALQGDLERAGGTVVLRSPVQAWAPQAGGGAVLQVTSTDGPFELSARRVINAAGLGACGLAARLHGLPSAFAPQGRYAKGSYFTLAGRSPFRRLIYPAPVDAWLGVHVTLDLGGQAKFGPDLEWLDTADPAAIDYSVDSARAAAFEVAVRRYWPGLPDGALQAGYSGVRPKIHGPGSPAPDFRIDGPAAHGLPGIVNLLGIESPGLTASMAIAESVLQALD
jgi:L-2-hydroxyglutarate oxidase LhgO